MATQNPDEAAASPDEATASPDRITFELELLKLEGAHQLAVSGRWFGVRGRRFMRPTLTLTLRSDGSERRALAELEHKPWAAEDGEPWIAAFRIPVALDQAAQLELSVAPDVAVELSQARAGAKGRRGARATVSGAPDARAPRVRTERVPARPSASDRELEIERLTSRLTAAERESEREHAKRQAADQALEEERSEALGLRSEVGQLRVQLELAATIRSELDATAAELDATRTEARESLTRLEAANRALDEHRTEAQRLREQLTAAEAAIQRLSQAHETAERHAAEAADRRAADAAEHERHAAEVAPREGQAAEVAQRERQAAEGAQRERQAAEGAQRERQAAEGAQRERQAREGETVKMSARSARPDRPAGAASSPAPIGPIGPDPAEPATRELHERAPVRRPRPQVRTESLYPYPARPLNPSLRSRRWLGRLVALIVICGVIAAIVLVVHSAMPSLP